MNGSSGPARQRIWGWVGVVAQVVFVGSWLIAGLWQGPTYHVLRDTISDMYAVTAPYGWFLVLVLTLTGAGTIGFAWLGLRASLIHHSSGPGRTATWGAVLLSLSIFGLGDLLSVGEREACRIADAGCTPADQLDNLGGRLDAVLSLLGLMIVVAAGFILAAAMQRSPSWSTWAWPTRAVTILIIVLIVGTGAVPAGLGGLLERLLAAVGAVGIAALAGRTIQLAQPARTSGGRQGRP